MLSDCTVKKGCVGGWMTGVVMPMNSDKERPNVTIKWLVAVKL